MRLLRRDIVTSVISEESGDRAETLGPWSSDRGHGTLVTTAAKIRVTTTLMSR